MSTPCRKATQTGTSRCELPRVRARPLVRICWDFLGDPRQLFRQFWGNFDHFWTIFGPNYFLPFLTENPQNPQKIRCVAVWRIFYIDPPPRGGRGCHKSPKILIPQPARRGGSAVPEGGGPPEASGSCQKSTARGRGAVPFCFPISANPGAQEGAHPRVEVSGQGPRR